VILDEVYPTMDGRWAGCGDPYRRQADVHRGALQARPIDFKPVTLDRARLTAGETESYPSAYFSREGDAIRCRAGVYAEELFEIRRNGVLKARRIFK
jgi:hypothetical protein